MEQLLLRDCPRDRARLAPHAEKHGARHVTIDVCPACGGAYLDHDELSLLVPDAKVAAHFQRLLTGEPVGEALCAGCGGLMRLRFGADVEVDVCEKCHGVWLDRGELERLAALHARDLPDETRGMKLAREAAKFDGKPPREASPLYVVTGVWAFAGILARLLRR
jgi:Zn-finger nucleic acid-binding protein